STSTTPTWPPRTASRWSSYAPTATSHGVAISCHRTVAPSSTPFVVPAHPRTHHVPSTATVQQGVTREDHRIQRRTGWRNGHRIRLGHLRVVRDRTRPVPPGRSRRRHIPVRRTAAPDRRDDGRDTDCRACG